MSISLFRDVKVALRGLRRTPAFTVSAIAALALGIGATAAMLTMIDAIIVESLPYREPDRLVIFSGQKVQDGSPRSWPLGYADIDDLRQKSSLFSAVSATSSVRSFNMRAGDAVEHVDAEMVHGEFFQVYGVSMHLGRTFSAEEATAGTATRVAVISHALWQSRFSSDEAVLGKPLHLNDEAYTIIGVAPRGFTGLSDDAQLWLPIGIAGQLYGPHYTGMRQFRWITGVARLAPGVSAERVNAELGQLATALEQQFPVDNEGFSIQFQLLPDAFFGTLADPLKSLLGAAAIVLLIALVNVANLQLARGIARTREFSVRVALGASGARLSRQSLTESLVIVLIAAVFGLTLAWAALRLMVSSGVLELPTFVQLGLDWDVVLLTVLIAIVAALGFGAAPAAMAVRINPVQGLSQGGRSGTTSRATLRLQRTLVVAEVALAMTLLVGAGLMIKGFQQYVATDLGFDRNGLYTAMIDLNAPRYAQNPVVQALARRSVEELSAIPGVQSVALEGPGIVASGTFAAHLRREGDTSPKPVDYLTRRHNVTPGYFRTMNIPVLAGRDFGDEDTPTSQRTIVISKALADRVWPGENAVGRVMLTVGNAPVQLLVVGVVGDVVHAGLDPEAAQNPDVYLSFYQSPPRSPSRASFLIRYSGSFASIAPAIQRTFKEIAPDLPLFDVQSMESRLAEQTRSARMMVLLMSIFAAVALTLAAIGIFGVVSYMASQRYRELGIRAALGASRRNILLEVVGTGLKPVAIGLGVGLVGTWALTRVLVSMLYGVNPLDPVIIAGMIVVMIGCALLGAAFPAIRASRVDPQVALTAE